MSWKVFSYIILLLFGVMASSCCRYRGCHYNVKIGRSLHSAFQIQTACMRITAAEFLIMHDFSHNRINFIVTYENPVHEKCILVIVHVPSYMPHPHYHHPISSLLVTMLVLLSSYCLIRPRGASAAAAAMTFSTGITRQVTPSHRMISQHKTQTVTIMHYTTIKGMSDSSDEAYADSKSVSVTGIVYRPSQEATQQQLYSYPTVTLFTKDGCTLCDKVKDTLFSIRDQYPHTLEVRIFLGLYFIL